MTQSLTGNFAVHVYVIISQFCIYQQRMVKDYYGNGIYLFALNVIKL